MIDSDRISSAAQALDKRRPVAAPWHTVVFVVGLLSYSYLQQLPSFTARMAQAPSLVPTYLLTICFELFLLGYIWLLGLRPRKVSLRELIGGKWDSWSDVGKDIGVAVLFWLVVLVVLAVLTYVLRFNGIDAAKLLIPKTTVEALLWVPVAITAGFCEELIFRGYLQRQFLALTGNVAAAVVLQGLVFGAGHLYQGARGVVVISVYGMLFGALAAMRKSLRPGMIQHGAQDTISGLTAYVLVKLKYVHPLGL